MVSLVTQTRTTRGKITVMYIPGNGVSSETQTRATRAKITVLLVLATSLLNFGYLSVTSIRHLSWGSTSPFSIFGYLSVEFFSTSVMYIPGKGGVS